MRTLSILICGSDTPAMNRMAEALSDEGVEVATSARPADCLNSNENEWDFLLVDLDGLDSFLRSLLPAITHHFPHLPVVGVSTKSSSTGDPNLNHGLKLDAFLDRLPRAEDLIVSSPQVAAKYLCDTKPLG